LATLFEGAGLRGVTTFEIQTYIPSHISAGAGLIAGVAGRLARSIIRHGIATAEQLGVSTALAGLAGSR
jgi:hypothetical protein